MFQKQVIMKQLIYIILSTEFAKKLTRNVFFPIKPLNTFLINHSIFLRFFNKMS